MTSPGSFRTAGPCLRLVRIRRWYSFNSARRLPQLIPELDCSAGARRDAAALLGEFRALARVPPRAATSPDASPLILRNFVARPAAADGDATGPFSWWDEQAASRRPTASARFRKLALAVGGGASWVPFEMTTSPSGATERAFCVWLQPDKDAAAEEAAYRLALVSLFEAMIGDSSAQVASGGASGGFHRFEAPLSLIVLAADFNDSLSDSPAGAPPIPLAMYVAQAPLDLLAPGLQRDATTPNLVRDAGRGDVYGTSLWAGLEPTNTPLHRDPNPNLFFQVAGAKVVRLMRPRAGQALYEAVRRRVLEQTGTPRAVGSRLRGEEMMYGPERVMLDASVWGESGDGAGELMNGSQTLLFEANLSAGDAMFIPLGWWHSIRSTNLDGRLNLSANWWFR